MAEKKKSKAGAKAQPAAEPSGPTAALLKVGEGSIGEVALSPKVFAVKVNDHLLYETVKQYRAGGRRGTHMTKNRALVSGSGRKPWRQKGTGRARVGETRNPLWRHGGTVFGPTPRDYSYAIPKKTRAAALRSALSQKRSEGALKVVEALTLDQPKTKQLKSMLTSLGVVGKALIVDAQPLPALVLSGRNIPGIQVTAVSHLNVYDVLDCKTLIVTREGLTKLEEQLAS